MNISIIVMGIVLVGLNCWQKNWAAAIAWGIVVLRSIQILIYENER